MVIITYEAIEDAFAAAAKDKKDMSPEIRKGDWVFLGKGGYGKAYKKAHVEDLTTGGWLLVAHGSREGMLHYRLRLDRQPVNPQFVTELWRKRQVVKQDTFEFEGKTIQTSELTDEWYLVW